MDCRKGELKVCLHRINSCVCCCLRLISYYYFFFLLGVVVNCLEMKRGKFDSMVSRNRIRLLQILMGLVFLYLLLMSFEIPLVYRTGYESVPGDETFGFTSDALPRSFLLESEEEMGDKDAPRRPSDDPFKISYGAPHRTPERRMREFSKVSGLVFDEATFDRNASKGEFSELQKAAKHAWVVGKKLWEDLESGKIELKPETKTENQSEPCPHSITLSGSEFETQSRIMVLPCGLTLWSHITVVGTPRWAHSEQDPKISILREGDDPVMVSQFMMELQGLKTVDGEDPPRILHFNPRLKGDWSGKPVIEQNTCYRMQWSTALRCEGWKSRADEETGKKWSFMLFENALFSFSLVFVLSIDKNFVLN